MENLSRDFLMFDIKPWPTIVVVCLCLTSNRGPEIAFFDLDLDLFMFDVKPWSNI